MPRTASGSSWTRRSGPVTVTKKGRPTAVVMSIEDYERMRGAAWKRLFETMKTARKEAAGRGLTDELLADES
jgi:prevent-host-death family protein